MNKEIPVLNPSRTPTAVGTLFPIYAIGVVGSFLQIVGAQWDVSWHILGIVETFFTPAHAVLYAGIGLVALANLFGIIRSQEFRRNPLNSGLLLGLRIAVVGTLLQLVAAPFDFWWHSTYGFDPFLFTPAHSLLIVGLFLGGTGMSLGAVRLLLAQRSGIEVVKGSTKFLSAVAILALATVWVQINFFSYYATDVVGMAYTLNICSITQFRTQGIDSCQFVNQFSLLSSLVAVMLFAAGGTLVFWVSKRLFSRRGVFTGISAIVMSVYSIVAIGFTGWALEFLNPPGTFYLTTPSPQIGAYVLSMELPFYLLFIIPMVLLDIGIKSWAARRKMVALSALVSLATAYMDGRFSSQTGPNLLYGSNVAEFLILAIPMLVAGLVSSYLLARFWVLDAGRTSLL